MQTKHYLIGHDGRLAYRLSRSNTVWQIIDSSHKQILEKHPVASIISCVSFLKRNMMPCSELYLDDKRCWDPIVHCWQLSRACNCGIDNYTQIRVSSCSLSSKKWVTKVNQGLTKIYFDLNNTISWKRRVTLTHYLEIWKYPSFAPKRSTLSNTVMTEQHLQSWNIRTRSQYDRWWSKHWKRIWILSAVHVSCRSASEPTKSC